MGVGDLGHNSLGQEEALEIMLSDAIILRGETASGQAE